MNNYLRIYIDSTFDLAHTLSIKSHFSARVLNRWVESHYGKVYDEADPRTWKYYLNIAGEYAPYDTRMTAVSMDTLEEIEFNKANLALHRATSRAYQYGTRHYRELVAKYPQNEQLIRGILYPADLEQAIQAPDYSILSYPDYLIESHETSLIPKLQEWIWAFQERWNNQQYRISDDLYEASFLGILHMGTVLALLAFRLEAAKTNEVNSYYIRQYLASHGKLDRYINTLSRKQQLFLYRNLPWLERNSGRTDSYETIIENILTERHIPLVSYRMVHQVDELTETLTPKVVFKATKENAPAFVADDVFETTTRMLAKAEHIAPRNMEERIHEGEAIEQAFADSLSNRVQTKSLESSMSDFGDMGPYRLSEVLTNHWVYLSSVGIYNSYIMIENPRNGSSMPLNAKDAYILANYLLAHLYDRTPTFIPTFTVSRVQRIIRPSIEDILGIADKQRFDVAFVNDLIKHQPTLIPVVSIDAFYEKCSEILLSMTYQRYVAANTESFMKRAQVHAMSTYLYGTKKCQLADEPEQLYAQWFQSRNIEIEDFLSGDVESVYLSIVRQATGLDLNTTVSIRNIQADMLSIMSQLSSYSIQLLRNINTEALEVLGWPVVRPDHLTGSSGGHQGLIKGYVDIFNQSGSMSHRIFTDIDETVQVLRMQGSLDSYHFIELHDLIRFEPFDRTDKYFINVGKITPKNVNPNEGQYPGVITVPGTDEYMALTVEQRRSLPDIQF